MYIDDIIKIILPTASEMIKTEMIYIRFFVPRFLLIKGSPFRKGLNRNKAKTQIIKDEIWFKGSSYHNKRGFYKENRINAGV